MFRNGSQLDMGERGRAGQEHISKFPTGRCDLIGRGTEARPDDDASELRSGGGCGCVGQSKEGRVRILRVDVVDAHYSPYPI